MHPRISSFSNRYGSAPFSPTANFPWETILDPGFAHLVTLHYLLLFIPNSPPPGVELTPMQYICQVAPSFNLCFILLWWWFFICWLPFLTHFSLSLSFLLLFVFLPRKTWLRYQKRWNYRNSNLKKTLKKNKKILNNSFSFINIFHCFLRLVSRSL